ncbi:hypothetical protein GLX_19110 [Komagataeibacter medellinensis NBRC 3288]|uniref:Integral membrane protein n=2 Tax=Komagataeibacter medellinensis TaxID=1177712 RepID=G2I065_KOMMN|nr:hypothetical protein GLX_19110 [Komagataeibacter medellinensis NBRC 3288]
MCDPARTQMKTKIWAFLLFVHAAVLGCIVWLARSYGGIAAASCHWDCSDAYMRIVDQGYDRTSSLAAQWLGEANWAFFPAFPLTLRTIRDLTGLPAPDVGIILNAVLLPMLAWLCYQYQNRKWGPVDYRLYFLFFFTFPATLWFRVQYTECMFGLFLMGMAWAVLNSRFYVASLSALLLCLTRPTGILCVLVFAAFHIFMSWRRNVGYRGRERLQALAASVMDSSLLVLAGGTGISLFMIYLYRLTGDSLAFSHVQIAWHRVFHFPGYWVWFNLEHKTHVNLVVAAILDMIVIYKGFQKKLYLETTVLLVTFMVAFSSSLLSIHRIIMANPFFFMIVYACLMDMRPAVRNAFIAFFSVTLLVITVLWFHDTNLLY